MNKLNYLLIFAIIILLIGSAFFCFNLDKQNSDLESDFTLTSSEEIWKDYNSTELSFSIKIPKIVYGVDRCFSNRTIWVPVKVFEDKENGIAYITQEYYYDNWDSKLQNHTESCKKIIRTIDSLKEEREVVVQINDKVQTNANPFLTWVIIIKDINNDAELNKFIKDTYGFGCFIEKKEPWKQEGVYEIKIKGEDWDEGTDLGNTTCPFNYTYKILYAPEKNKIMSVNLGQECGFTTDPNFKLYKCYDEEMIDSFEFK